MNSDNATDPSDFAAEALPSEPQFTQADAERVPTPAQAEALWQLLDNIDTLDDTCRENHEAYRRSVRRLVALRFEMAGSDGYRLFWKDGEPRDFTNPGFSFPISKERAKALGGCGT